MGKGNQGDGDDHRLTMRPELFAAVGRGCRAQEFERIKRRRGVSAQDGC